MIGQPTRPGTPWWPVIAAALAAAAIAAADQGAPAGAPETPAPTAAPPPAAPAVPAHRQANTVAILTVHGPIDTITLWSLERRIARARQEGADAVVLDLDTPGGELGATLEISRLIKTDAPVNTVAWINPQAYSAGTIIALACQEIVVAPASSFGDAAPIQFGPLGIIPMGQTERAKMESPILEEVIDSARRNHYDENLVKSFVSVGVELWLIEHLKSGEKVFVDRAEYQAVFGEPPPEQLTPLAAPDSLQTQAPVRPWFNTVIPAEESPRAPEEMQRSIEMAQTLPPARARLTEADRGQWKQLTQVVGRDQLLTVKAGAARFFGLAQATIANEEELKQFLGAQTLRRYQPAWSEGLVRFLTHPVVRGVLLVIFLVCLFMELGTPGLGLFGGGAMVALLLLLGAPHLVGMAEWWDVLLVIVGLGLVAVELFLLPGFGVAGVIGIVALLVGLVGTFVSEDVTTPHGQTQLATGLITTLAALFAAGLGAWLISRQLGALPLFRRLVLHAEVGGEPQPDILSAMAPAAAALRAGALGLAATDLHPAGRGEFDGKLRDVKSVGGYIARGTTIRVVSTTSFEVMVEEAE